MNPSPKSGGLSKRPEGVGRKQPRPIDEICSGSSDSRSTPDATTARWYETFFCTRSTVTRTPEDETSRWRPEGRKRIIIDALAPNEEAKDVTVALVCFSRDVPDAGGIDRKDERVRRRTTGPCPMTREGLVDAVAGDQSTDGTSILTSTSVSPVYSPTLFPGWQGGADACASRAQETSHECMMFHWGASLSF